MSSRRCFRAAAVEPLVRISLLETGSFFACPRFCRLGFLLWHCSMVWGVYLCLLRDMIWVHTSSDILSRSRSIPDALVFAGDLCRPLRRSWQASASEESGLPSGDSLYFKSTHAVRGPNRDSYDSCLNSVLYEQPTKLVSMRGICLVPISPPPIRSKPRS